MTVTPFLDLVFVKNTGVSYGLFLQDTRQGQWLLAGFAALAVLRHGRLARPRRHHRLVAASLGLIMGGAASNAIDRLVLGGRCRLLLAARLRLLLVRVQYRRCGHCCRGHRPPL